MMARKPSASASDRCSGAFALHDGGVCTAGGHTVAGSLDAHPGCLQVVVQPLDRVAGHGQHHPVEAPGLVGAGGVVQEGEFVAGDAHRHEVGALHDAFGRGSHPPVLHVEGDAEVLAHHHAGGDDLDRAAPVGQQLGDARGVMEADLVDHHHVAVRFGGTGEHVAHIAHVRRIGRCPPRPLGFGTGGDDDVVGRLLGDETGPHADAVLDADAEAAALGELVAHDVAELGPVGDAGREAHLAARLGLLLVHRHPVTGTRRADGGLQSGWPSADDHHVADGWLRRRLGRQRHRPGRVLGFAAGAWVLDAAEPAVQAHAADALLIATQAQTDLVGGPGAGLGGEVGVGDLAAHDAHQVAVPLGQRPLGLQRILEPADAHHRQVDSLAERTGDEQRISGRDVHAGLDHEQARRRHPDRGVDVVDVSGGLDDAGDLDGVVDGGAALDELVAADAHAQCQPVADHPANRCHDFREQPGAIGETAAVCVGAPVRGGRQEAAHDR